MNYLNFTVKQTAATVHFFDRLVQGTHIPTAVLTCRKAGGGQEKFHQITLKEAYVAQHQLGGSAGSESNTESFSLAYGSIKQEYFKQGTNGTTTSAGAKTWDPHKVEPLNNVNVSQIFWGNWLGKPLEGMPILVREAPGLILVALYMLALPPLLAATVMRKFFVKMGFFRFFMLVTLIQFMASLPIKMVLRWVLNLKYIVAIPEYFFNI